MKKKKKMLQTFGLGDFIGVQKEPGICYKEYAQFNLCVHLAHEFCSCF